MLGRVDDRLNLDQARKEVRGRVMGVPVSREE